MKTDVQLQPDVIEGLKWEPSIDNTHIGRDVIEGIVALGGIYMAFRRNGMPNRPRRGCMMSKRMRRKLVVKFREMAASLQPDGRPGYCSIPAENRQDARVHLSYA